MKYPKWLQPWKPKRYCIKRYFVLADQRWEDATVHPVNVSKRTSYRFLCHVLDGFELSLAAWLESYVARANEGHLVLCTCDWEVHYIIEQVASD